MGHLGMNPEVKTMDNGSKLAKISLATNHTYVNNKGERITDTDWHNIVAWGKNAELAEKYMQKGSEIMVEGRLTYKEYLAKDGTKRYTTEVVANAILLMDKKQEAERTD